MANRCEHFSGGRLSARKVSSTWLLLGVSAIVRALIGYRARAEQRP